MPTSISQRTGAHILVDQLIVHRADRAYCVPGESYLAVLDALHDQPDFSLVVARHEAGACNMAEAHGKLTGKPGLCFVTRGPGATHASIGIHTAMQDSTPLILFVGQARRDMLEREAFQELDYRAVFGSMAKWVVQLEDPQRIPELVARAFRVATSGRPGPVVIAMPEDVLTAKAAVADAPAFVPAQSAPAAGDMERLRAILDSARQPLIIVGGSTWDAASAQAVSDWAEAASLPVAAAFRRQDLVDNRKPHYAGHLGIGADARLLQRVAQADLLLVLGDRLAEATSQGYTAIRSPAPSQRLVHVHPDPCEIGRVFSPELGIVSGMGHFAAALAGVKLGARKGWRDWTAGAHEEFLAVHARSNPADTVDLWEVIGALSEVLPDDAIVANGAGNYAGWLHARYSHRSFGTQLAPANGAMGYGIPAAIAAKHLHPTRTVVAVAGDGCFMMSAQELATAALHQLPIVVVVVNNGVFGTIRMHQEMHYPRRVSGTSLANPDFQLFGRSFGAHVEQVLATKDFRPALERAIASGRTALIEVVCDPERISPKATISQLRERRREEATVAP
ncbi:Acetolactate synthase isozyme 2 large subunit [Xylophilus ampelinus]|nr:Acetolactate synthase isozyme 2 large subunit [Xylophilus ampelinus]